MISTYCEDSFINRLFLEFCEDDEELSRTSETGRKTAFRAFYKGLMDGVKYFRIGTQEDKARQADLNR